SAEREAQLPHDFSTRRTLREMFGVARARRRGQRVLRERTQLVSVEMSIVRRCLRVARNVAVSTAHAPQQQIDLVVCFAFHLQHAKDCQRENVTIAIPCSQKLSSLIRPSKSVSRCCATSANERSVSAVVQPRSAVRIWPTRFR